MCICGLTHITSCHKQMIELSFYRPRFYVISLAGCLFWFLWKLNLTRLSSISLEWNETKFIEQRRTVLNHLGLVELLSIPLFSCVSFHLAAIDLWLDARFVSINFLSWNSSSSEIDRSEMLKLTAINFNLFLWFTVVCSTRASFGAWRSLSSSLPSAGNRKQRASSVSYQNLHQRNWSTEDKSRRAVIKARAGEVGVQWLGKFWLEEFERNSHEKTSFM